MKSKIPKRILSSLLALIMIISVMPISNMTVFAAHKCPDCQDLIDGSPYCSECYKCDACVELCIECGVCTDCSGSEICDGCSNEEIGDNMCLECAIEKGTHCPDCDQCYFQVYIWCEECGLCVDCVEIDSRCSDVHGMNLCFDCAADMGSHCPGCEQCYNEVEHFCGECGLCDECADYDNLCSDIHGIDLCFGCAANHGNHCPGCEQCYNEVVHFCGECGLCDECADYDERCSDYNGTDLCEECAIDYGRHCPNCDQCYFKVQQWCEECGQCIDCCPVCNYCCEETGKDICVECAIDSGMHCPECSECYGECGGEFCLDCGICANCAEINPNEDLCLDCAIAAGLHCPNCISYIEDVPLCEGCGEYCLECAEAFCENCNLCSECVLMCQDCGSCEECATICPNCEEYCSECVGLCDDCGLCLVCCEDIANFTGCDCGEWVCVENIDWNEHFAEEHSDTEPEQSSHTKRPMPTWDWDSTYHWHNCTYCREDAHLTGKSKHTFDSNGICTVCRYVKDAKIQILVQPSDSKATFVTSPDEDYDERNIARFSVKVSGESELTYTWYKGYYHYGEGKMVYSPLTDPQGGEDYKGSEIYWLVPTDACTRDWYIRCVITDIYGNEVTTRDALVQSKHNYQYFKLYKSNQYPLEYAERNQYGHVLQCVADDCKKVTYLRPHEDEDRNGYCDICEYEIGKILITKQPKNSSTAYSYNPDEGYDESNFAYFSVTAEGESKLTYTWCRKQYVGGVLKYVPLTNPEQDEVYDGPELKLLVPEDACCNQYTYACIITDEEGNETRTVDVTLTAKHNYQYYRDYLTNRLDPYGDARKKYHGHILVCVSPECGKVTRLRQHVDENSDYFCDICNSQKDLQYVGITVTAPKEGQLPNYNVVTDSVAYYAMGGSSNYTQYRFWFVSDNGTSNWKLIDKTTPFVAGKYYKFVVEMQTRSGYTFPTYNSEPSFWAKVNGDYVMPQKTYGMDPTKYVTVSYEFGECNDSVIENIIIENVTAPVAGEKPDYSATIRGSGYYIDSTKNAQLDDYWNNPQKKPHYIKNGIAWFDMTDFDWVYENEYFVPGHEYQVRVYLKTEDGYTFYHDKWYDMLFSASVNGFGAEGNTSGSSGLYEQTISASFTCEGKEITTVMVNGLSVPRAGETPDYTASPAYPEWYQLDPNYAGTNGIIWYDSEDNMMDPEDTFVAGEIYKVEIKVIPTQINGSNASKFVSPAAYVNGKQVTANGDWDAVYSTANTVYIYYTFQKAVEPAGYAVSGQVTSFGNSSGDVTVQLIPQGLTEPAYETIVKGNTVNYSFASVPTGTYTMKVSKANHVTREYTIVVGKEAVVQNVKIHLKGDVNGDGSVTIVDVNRANLHFKNKSALSGYNLLCADINGDGKVTILDVNRMNLHFKNKTKLW